MENKLIIEIKDEDKLNVILLAGALTCLKMAVSIQDC